MAEGSGPAGTAPAKRGLVLVNTGNGKGKTTAALGTALRTVGYGRKVLIIQFIKGTWHYGEIEALARLPEITLVRAGKGFYKIVDDHFPEEVHRAAAREGLELARRSIAANEHALVILDEINVAVAVGLLEVADVLALLDLKPPEMSLILTGRDAHPEVIARADTVTEMREIKHPYQKGILAQKGIDY
ncbi:MAG TPA: cob(I)yrinic acid a,c-diamide adenosyltransferase [Polyangia bacterium]|jgi:cob(I)alamin adenosyltransferase